MRSIVLLFCLLFSQISYSQIIEEGGIRFGSSISKIEIQSGDKSLSFGHLVTFSPSLFVNTKIADNILLMSEVGYLTKGGTRNYNFYWYDNDIYSSRYDKWKYKHNYISCLSQLLYRKKFNEFFGYIATGPRVDISTMTPDYIKSVTYGINTSLGIGYTIGKWNISAEFRKYFNLTNIANCTTNNYYNYTITDNTMLFSIGVARKIGEKE